MNIKLCTLQQSTGLQQILHIPKWLVYNMTFPFFSPEIKVQKKRTRMSTCLTHSQSEFKFGVMRVCHMAMHLFVVPIITVVASCGSGLVLSSVCSTNDITEPNVQLLPMHPKQVLAMPLATSNLAESSRMTPGIAGVSRDSRRTAWAQRTWHGTTTAPSRNKTEVRRVMFILWNKLKFVMFWFAISPSSEAF